MNCQSSNMAGTDIIIDIPSKTNGPTETATVQATATVQTSVQKTDQDPATVPVLATVQVSEDSTVPSTVPFQVVCKNCLTSKLVLNTVNWLIFISILMLITRLSANNLSYNIPLIILGAIVLFWGYRSCCFKRIM